MRFTLRALVCVCGWVVAVCACAFQPYAKQNDRQKYGFSQSAWIWCYILVFFHYCFSLSLHFSCSAALLFSFHLFGKLDHCMIWFCFKLPHNVFSLFCSFWNSFIVLSLLCTLQWLWVFESLLTIHMNTKTKLNISFWSIKLSLFLLFRSFLGDDAFMSCCSSFSQSFRAHLNRSNFEFLFNKFLSFLILWSNMATYFLAHFTYGRNGTGSEQSWVSWEFFLSLSLNLAVAWCEHNFRCLICFKNGKMRRCRRCTAHYFLFDLDEIKNGFLLREMSRTLISFVGACASLWGKWTRLWAKDKILEGERERGMEEESICHAQSCLFCL